jgi:hypothetical protein
MTKITAMEETTPSFHMEIITDEKEDIYDPEGPLQSLVYSFPLVEKEIIAENLAVLGGASNCNGKTPGLVAKNIWIENSFHNKLTGDRIYASGEVRDSKIKAKIGIEINNVYNSNPIEGSILEIASFYDISEKDKVQEEFQNALLDTKRKRERLVKTPMGTLLRKLQITPEKIVAREQLENLKGIIDYAKRNKSKEELSEIQSALKDYNQARYNLMEFRNYIGNTEGYSEGIKVHKFLDAGTKIILGNDQLTIDEKIYVPENKIYEAKIIKGRIQENFVEKGDFNVGLETKIMGQLI